MRSLPVIIFFVFTFILEAGINLEFLSIIYHRVMLWRGKFLGLKDSCVSRSSLVGVCSSALAGIGTSLSIHCERGAIIAQIIVLASKSSIRLISAAICNRKKKWHWVVNTAPELCGLRSSSLEPALSVLLPPVLCGVFFLQPSGRVVRLLLLLSAASLHRFANLIARVRAESRKTPCGCCIMLYPKAL